MFLCHSSQHDDFCRHDRCFQIFLESFTPILKIPILSIFFRWVVQPPTSLSFSEQKKLGTQLRCRLKRQMIWPNWSDQTAEVSHPKCQKICSSSGNEKFLFQFFVGYVFFPPPFQKPNRKSLVLLELGPTKGPFKGPFSSPDSGPQGYSYTAPVWMGEFGQMLRGSYWLNMLSTFGEDLLFFFWPFWESGSGVMLMLMLLMLMLMLLDGCISYYI